MTSGKEAGATAMVPLSHSEALAAAYAALAALRARGVTPITVAAVARVAGLARSVIYKDDADWQQLRDVIAGRAPAAIELEAATFNLREREGWELALDRLAARMAACEGETIAIKTLADGVYTTLLTQLHRYVAKAKSAPETRERLSKLQKDNEEYTRLVPQLRAEIATLRANRAVPGEIRSLTRKEVVSSSGADLRQDTLVVSDVDDMLIEEINALDAHFDDANPARIPSTVYVLYGNVASGKSIWINEHQPATPGVSLYIDGPHHTKTARRMVLKRVRKLKPICRVVCVRIQANIDLCLERNKSPIRVRRHRAVPDAVIRDIGAALEEVTLDEGFDAIEIVDVGGRDGR